MEALAKRGRPKTDTHVLVTRGSWRGKAKLKAERKAALAAKAAKRKSPPPPTRPSLPGPRAEKTWMKLLCSLPGYHPFADTGGARFDATLARKAIDFFETQLTHVKGAKARHREPFILEKWERAIIANLFGWINPDGWRRYREALIFVPRKNGKTPLAAGIILYGLFEDGEPGAEIYGAASEYKQASLVFAHAQGMVLQNPDLLDRAQIFKGQAKAIQLGPETGHSRYAVVSSDALSAHGWNMHIGVIDELHTQPDRELYDAMVTGMANRDQPLLVSITTSDYDRPGSICNEKHEYATKVRDGIISDPGFLPVIYEATPDDDWTSRAVWARVNPNLGVSVKLEHLEREFKKATENPAYENTFKRLHLNIRTEQDVRWLPIETWDACGVKPVDAVALRGQPCWAGLDLSSTRDITALVLVFPGDAGVVLLPYFWVPEDTLRAHGRGDKVDYTVWVRDGWLEVTPGPVIDYAVIRRRINEIGEEYPIEEIAADILFQGQQLCGELQEDGFTVVVQRQGFLSMAAPTAELERLIVAVQLSHGGNPVLRWMASNVAIELDAAGNMKPSKKTSSGKIDGIIAAIGGLSRVMVRQDDSCVYTAERGLQTVDLEPDEEDSLWLDDDED